MLMIEPDKRYSFEELMMLLEHTENDPLYYRNQVMTNTIWG